METTCPQCAQTLRVPDGLNNPLLRCPSCGEKFRFATRSHESDVSERKGDRTSPFATAPAPAPELQEDRRWQEFVATQQKSPAPVLGKRSSSATGGVRRFGWGTFVLFLIVMKTGPKLLRIFNRPQPAQPAPVRMNDEQRRAVEQLLREIPQHKRAQPAEFPDPNPAPELAPGNDPQDLRRF